MSHLSDAGRALEVVDARLVAIQSKLAWTAVNNSENAEMVDLLDLVIGDVRSAAGNIAEHTCVDVELQRKYDDLALENEQLGRLIRSSG